MPGKTVTQFVEPADIAGHPIGHRAVRLDCRGRTIRAAGGIQPFAHIGQVIIGRLDQQLAGRIDRAPQVALAHHCHAVMEFADFAVLEQRQVVALGKRIQRLGNAVGKNDRILPENRHVTRFDAAFQCVQRLSLGVDGQILSVRRAYQRAAAGKDARILEAACKRAAAVLRHIGVQAGRRAFAQQQPVLKKALGPVIGADLFSLQRIVHTMVGIAVGDSVLGKFDRNRRIGIIHDQITLAVDHRGLPLVVLDRRQTAFGKFPGLRVGKRQRCAALLIQIAVPGHAVDIRALHREDRPCGRSTYYHDKRHKQGGYGFLEHNFFHPWVIDI